MIDARDKGFFFVQINNIQQYYDNNKIKFRLVLVICTNNHVRHSDLELVY